MIYEFQCQSCGLVFEKNLAISNRGDPQECPKCGGEGKRGMFTAPLLSYKHGADKNAPEKAIRRWERAHKQKMNAEKKKEAE